MTDKKDFKKLVRERMAKTGESYTSARMHLLRSGPWEQIDEETEASLAREVEARGIRVIHEASGAWAARTDEYPDLVEHADTPKRAKRLLLDAIWWKESDWRDHVDDETATYLDLQDD